jgi:DNA-binding winged helix-turn-helix (wHTH) protein
VTTDTQRPSRLRFGMYEMDARTGEVWREGLPVHLPPQPFKVLFLLASHAGDVVTREEIRRELWGDDTFVDFDGGLNFCVNQIRKALRDNAESPRFIHTLPRRGYRFIASVEPVAVSPLAATGSVSAGSALDTGHGDAVALDPSAMGEPDDGSGTPRARGGHLYEVVRERTDDSRRYRSGMGGFGRLAVSPAAVEEPAAKAAPRAEPVPAALPERPEAEVGAPDAPPLATSDPPAPALATAPPAARRPPSMVFWAGLGTVLLLVAALAAIVSARRGRVDPVYERLTFRRGTVSTARFGPSGEVFYGAMWDAGPRRAYVTRPGETVPRALDLPDRALVLKMLRSGELAVLLRRDTDVVLALAPAGGGAPREIVEGISGADVSADGQHIAVVRSGAEDRVELPPGHEIHRSAAKINSLRLSPTGDRVAFLVHPVPGDDRGEVVAVDAAGRRTVLSRDWSSLEGLAWSADGGEVWFTGARVGADSTLNAVDLSGAERVVSRGPGRLVLHDIRDDGAVLLERTTRRTEMRGRFGGLEAPERDLSWLDLSMVTDVSADGRSVVFGESGEGGGPGYGVFLRPTDGAPPVRLGDGRAMTLSPDGRWVLSIPLFGMPRIVALPTGAGEARTLGTGLTRHAWAVWFPDSSRVAFTAAEAGQPLRVYVQDLEGGAPRAITGEVGGAMFLVTRDGARVLARTPGTRGVWQLHPLDGGAVEPAPLASLDRPLAFSTDGRALFVAPFSLAGPFVVERLDLATGARTRWTELTAEDNSGIHPMMQFVITPDGRSYAYSVNRVLSELYLVRGLR